MRVAAASIDQIPDVRLGDHPIRLGILFEFRVEELPADFEPQTPILPERLLNSLQTRSLFLRLEPPG